MIVRNLARQKPFTTKDGSQIRSLLDLSCAPVKNQSLAEAVLPAGGATERHFHRLSEEFYFVTRGEGLMEIDGETQEVRPGDAILIPAGAWHQISSREGIEFLCCCAPPYSHEDTYFEEITVDPVN
jgi:mannose-6-phosphate isomerase-like protein (cupin superfamily)